MPDILFTNAYHISNDHHEQITMRPYPALGPLYVAAYLRQHGYEVAFFDSVFQTNEEALLETVRVSAPRFVGVSALVIGRATAREQIRALKAMGCMVIAGGPDPSIVPETYLREFGADYVVMGEGEYTTRELLDSLSGRGTIPVEEVRGIAFLKEGRLTITRAREKIQDLDGLPWPARDLMDFTPYLAAWRSRHGYSSVHLLTSRGCPFRCNWCSKGVYGKTFRARDPKDVAREMRWLRETYQPERLWVADDLLGVKRSWVTAWRKAVLAEDAAMPFECLSRADLLTPQMLAELKEIGCFRVYFGAESGSQRVLDAMQKDTKVDEIRAAAAMLKAAGIERGFFMMLGYPPEDIGDIRLTERMLMEIVPEMVGFSVAYPLEGTGFYEKVKAQIPVQAQQWRSGNENRVLFNAAYSTRFYAATIQRLQARLRLKRRTRVDRRVPVDLAKVAYYSFKAARARRDRRPRALPTGGPEFSHNG
ncbi:MAG TPA: radical SAM protein [Chloroflexota bacterium]|nr:radical SAM protein [Chloroflexota bacterium]